MYYFRVVEQALVCNAGFSLRSPAEAKASVAG